MSDGKGKSNHYSPVKQPPKTGFMHFLYNGDTGEVMGRSGVSWLKITIFYIFFFAGLAAFFGLMLFIFLTTLNDKEPRYKGSKSLIGTNPGVGFRPMPDQDKNVESTLIWFKQGDNADGEIWAKEIDKFLEVYEKPPPGTTIGCTSYDVIKDPPDAACKIDVSTLQECSSSNSRYGYTDGRAQPCIIVKLNKIYDWIPEPYLTKEDLDEAKSMPQDLKDHLIQVVNVTDPKRLNTTWITCEGENPADKENIGKLGYYYPGINGTSAFSGIPNFNFPFRNQDAYLAPFLFVKFEKPQPNVLIQVECKAWAKNISPDRQQRLGSVHFELMID